MQSWSVLAFFALILVVQSRSVYKKKEDDVENMLSSIVKRWRTSHRVCGWGTDSGLPWFSVGEEFEILDGCYKCSFAFDKHCRLFCAGTAKNCPKRSKRACSWLDPNLPAYFSGDKFDMVDGCFKCFFTESCETRCKPSGKRNCGEGDK